MLNLVSTTTSRENVMFSSCVNSTSGVNSMSCVVNTTRGNATSRLVTANFGNYVTREILRGTTHVKMSGTVSSIYLEIIAYEEMITNARINN